MYTIVYDLLIIFCAVAGFSIAFYIHIKKTAVKPLVCPLKSSCDFVVQSQYSNFFGIPVEMMGMFYYILVAVYHGVLIAVPEFLSPLTIMVALSMATTAFLFSIYLTSIQAFVLKQWCTWCLTSAFICLSIFSITLMSSPFSLSLMLGEYSKLFTILHLFAMAVGIGAATITDIFFFKFLQDKKISYFESDVMRTLSDIIWIALGVIVLSGIALFIPKAEILSESGKFIVKMIAVGVLILNGFLLNIVITPHLAQISFVGKDEKGSELHKLRKLAFAFGAISITTWYFVFILGALRGVTFPLMPLLGVYAGLIFVAVLGSQIFDRLFTKEKENNVI
jgi:uncharacterized membrane protein